ncbi:hypothetical protein scyTo_0008593 [Scyliorhinus torazame]|uniref:Uncharacterized protein n=1 Tax=Scyliorhinus torazame TaxID=75743 RepID=A0A401PBI4_SCYTO|nr:hypothetical protein [Scyliorhinus torazame]
MLERNLFDNESAAVSAHPELRWYLLADRAPLGAVLQRHFVVATPAPPLAVPTDFSIPPRRVIYPLTIRLRSGEPALCNGSCQDYLPSRPALFPGGGGYHSQ